MDLKGTRTEANLMAAFAGESQARNKYSYYASQAKKEGFVQIANIFEETANNEKEHAKIWFKLIHNGMPATLANLTDAAGGEHFEWTEMYANFANVADAEGFSEIAKLFREVADIEKEHEDRYKKLIDNLNSNLVFEKPVESEWHCQNCGHIHIGNAAPEICPVCTHPKAYFQIRATNY